MGTGKYIYEDDDDLLEPWFLPRPDTREELEEIRQAREKQEMNDWLSYFRYMKIGD